METAQLIESFNQAGQGHVFRFWNELSAADRAQLAAQAAEIDLAEIARLNDTLVRGRRTQPGSRGYLANTVRLLHAYRMMVF